MSLLPMPTLIFEDFTWKESVSLRKLDEKCLVHSQRPVPIWELSFSRGARAMKACVYTLADMSGSLLEPYVIGLPWWYSG